jgi:hypothetical protein
MKILKNSLAGGIEKKCLVWENKNYKIRDIFVVLFCYFEYLLIFILKIVLFDHLSIYYFSFDNKIRLFALLYAIN